MNLKFERLFDEIKQTKDVNVVYDKKIQDLHTDLEDLKQTVYTMYAKGRK